LLAKRACAVDGEREHARQRAEAEGDDEDESENDVRDGPAKFEQPARREHEPCLTGDIGRSDETERKGDDRAGQRADIGHQDRLADQSRGSFEAPEPCGRVGPDPRARVERRHSIEVAREAADLGEEGLGIDLSLFRRQDNQQERDGRAGE
jgi:hypothetical protein